MGKKGKRSIRGVPDIWDELKKRVNLTLTATAIDGLDTLAASYGLNRSEFVERIGRGLIPIPPP